MLGTFAMAYLKPNNTAQVKLYAVLKAGSQFASCFLLREKELPALKCLHFIVPGSNQMNHLCLLLCCLSVFPAVSRWICVPGPSTYVQLGNLAGRGVTAGALP